MPAAHAAVGISDSISFDKMLQTWQGISLALVVAVLFASVGVCIRLAMSARHHADRARRLAEAVSFANDGIWEWDIIKDSAYISSRASYLLGAGKNARQVPGPRDWFLQIVAERYSETVSKEFDRLMQSQTNQRFTMEFQIQSDNGGLWIRLRGKVVVDENRLAIRMGGAVTDISESKRFERQLMHRVMHDPLTGLPNRALLNDRLSNMLVQSQRSANPFSLLILDLNRFKEINDSLGHAVGDELLKATASRLSDLLRESDTVARLGGDEFAILLPNGPSSRACSVAEKITDELNKPFLLHEHTLFVRASIGIALFPEHGNTAETLMQRSDAAMYIAKRGNLGYTLYNAADNTGSKGKLELETHLREAIDNSELELHYQPKIDAKGNYISGVESLIRWHHEKHGQVAPREIAELAEKSGLIHPLTEWVVDKAFEQTAKWQKKGLLMPVSINLSVWNIQNPSFVAVVRRALAQWRVPPELVEFEITENAMIVDPVRAHRTLDRLSQLGLSFSVDDFGTGFSSLAYLQRLPVGTVKIDRSFVKDMHKNEFDRSIVQSTIDMAHNLGLQTVAEGVELEVTREILTKMGCNELQGFLFSKALIAEDLEDWLKITEFAVDQRMDFTEIDGIGDIASTRQAS